MTIVSSFPSFQQVSMALWTLVVLSLVTCLGFGQSASVSSGKFKCTVKTTISVIAKATALCVFGKVVAHPLSWLLGLVWLYLWLRKTTTAVFNCRCPDELSCKKGGWQQATVCPLLRLWPCFKYKMLMCEGCQTSRHTQLCWKYYTFVRRGASRN